MKRSSVLKHSSGGTAPVLGNIPPDNFIGIAEESNLILILSEWIMKRTGEYAEALYKQLDKDSTFSYISINISPAPVHPERLCRYHHIVRRFLRCSK